MDRYTVVRMAGRGAYGTVYLARRNTDGREVILKQIPVDMMSTADRQSILHEIKVSPRPGPHSSPGPCHAQSPKRD
jgi:serine/threonine protein kinase